jgi:class 3 adenylate cyclase
VTRGPDENTIDFGAGWDASRRWSLRFQSEDLERAYQEDVLELRRRRQRRATFDGSVIFVILAVIGPALAGLPVWPITPTLLLVAACNFAAAMLAGRARTVGQISAIGVSIQLVTGVLLLVVFVATDTFTRFGVPALMGQAVFAFGVTRHPFRNAVLISAGHTIDYVVFGVAQGLAPGVFVDAFILAAAIGGACAGTYVAERSERHLFAQRLLVADLHRRVNELFHHYLAPEVVDALISDPSRAELGGEEVEVTVLFADLTGFTSFSERVSPEEAVAMLNRAFAAAVPVVLAEGGTIVQFAGDAMMAIFNAPVRQPDHPIRAARAALRLQAETERSRAGDQTPRFRVGLNTGPALVGNVGSAELRSFTAIGDTTNLAARLQTYAPPGSVVLGERTRQLLGDLADVILLGTPQLKGKALPVNVYELRSLRGEGLHEKPLTVELGQEVSAQ